MAIYDQLDVIQVFDQLSEPMAGLPLKDVAKLKSYRFDDGEIHLSICFRYPIVGLEQKISDYLTQALLKEEAIQRVELNLSTDTVSHRVQSGLKGHQKIKNIIAVVSGKGGVGKSTVAVNMAFALQQLGLSVGILDADIYGPSQPHMLGITEKPQALDNKMMAPVLAHGLQTMSIGYLVSQDTPMIWRGPMVSSALQQLIFQTMWRDIDYLIVDMPPGTGDIPLTLSKKVPVSGSIVVTTPQDIALLDAKKAMAMFAKVGVPVLGLVENMSYYDCPHCQHRDHLFGKQGAVKLAEQAQVPVLAQLPLQLAIREDVDHGKPTTLKQPDGAIAQIFVNMAQQMLVRLAAQPIDYGNKFPEIVVEPA